jgi:TrmH family RNA methyltransferase
MVHIKKITSPVNPFIKKITLLQDKSRERKNSGLFVVEGMREVVMALKAGFSIENLIFNPYIISYNAILEQIGEKLFDIPLVEVPDPVYNKMAYREGTEGVIGLFKARQQSLGDLRIPEANPFLLIAEAPEKPGNIGAILRTADAAGVDAVIIANPHTDIYHPNIIRSSVGSVFSLQIVQAPTEDIITFLKDKSIPAYCAILSDASRSFYEFDYSVGCAIVVGTESTGLSDPWHHCDAYPVMIPMKGQLDSMNVAVSAGVLMFEVVRQKMNHL